MKKHVRNRSVDPPVTYNIGSMNDISKRVAVIAAIIVIASGIFSGIFLVGYHYFHRYVPLRQLVTPDYWKRHFKGNDFYDRDGMMLFHGNPVYHEIALTIDDGPHQIYGQAILHALAQEHVPATFFVVGIRVKQEPDQIRQMIAQGDEIGNHTYDHQRLDTLKPHLIASELRLDDEDIYRASGIHTHIMRPPGVQFNHKVLNVSRALHYITVNWTNAARDYEVQSPEYIVRHVVDSTENGSIILLHQDNPYTAIALPRIIGALKGRGYRFVTISTMLAHLGIQPYASLEIKARAKNPGNTPVLTNGGFYLEHTLPVLASGH